MNQPKARSFEELALEPMEVDLRENRLFGDFSSRDRGSFTANQRAEEIQRQREAQAAANAPEEPAKPATSGKANFCTDDRRVPDRRVASRRAVSRLTGDRRSGGDRRAKTDAWGREL